MYLNKKNLLKSYSKVFLFVAAHFSHHLLPSLLVPLLPFIRNDFGLNYAQSGFLVSAFTLSYGIAQLPAGWLTDAIGPRKMIFVAVSGVALAGLFVGISPTYWMAAVFLIVMGLAGGGYHPSAPPLISAAVKRQNIGMALGFHLAGGSTCFFLTPLVAAATVSALGWRGTFIGLSLPTMLFGVVLYVLIRPPENKPKAPKSAAPTASEKVSRKSNSIRIAAFLVLSVLSFAVVQSCIAFIPLFMVDHFHIDEKTAAIFLSIFYSAGFLAAPLGGYISDRIGSIPTLLASSFILGPLIFVLNVIDYGWGFGALILLIGIVAMARTPISELFIITETPAKYRSTILGIYFFSCTESGGVLTPFLGYLIDRFGFYNCFGGAGILLMLTTLVCAIFLSRPFQKAS